MVSAFVGLACFLQITLETVQGSDPENVGEATPSFEICIEPSQPFQAVYTRSLPTLITLVLMKFLLGVCLHNTTAPRKLSQV